MSSKIGTLVNVFGFIWLVMVIFFSTWPGLYPVTSTNMNYSIVVLASWVIIGGAYYLVRGRKVYAGPVVSASPDR